MPLESLNNEQINIHDLTLEQEKKPMPEAEKIFGSLKETEFYDKSDGYWRDSILTTGQIDKGFKMTETQLLSIVVEAQFNQNTAKRHYEELKNGSLMNKEIKKWYWGIEINELGPEGGLGLSGEACELVTQYYLKDPDFKQKFEAYKELYYKADKKMWSEQRSTDSLPNLWEQFMPILAQTLADPQEGQRQHADLINKMYDEDAKKWVLSYLNFSNPKAQPITAHANDVYYDLSDLLIRANFRDGKAGEDYRRLKESKLYNPASKKWGTSANAMNQGIDSCRINTQFLGVLCEHEFEEPEPDLQTSTPDLPETRKY